MELKENQKWCKGLEGRYFVQTDGTIWSLCSGGVKPIKGAIIFDKYRGIQTYRVFSACFEGKQKSLYFHRMVAEAFIPNTENKPQVNHKNGDKLDNRVENLEWVTQQENTQHAHDSGLINTYKVENYFNGGKRDILDDYLISGEKGMFKCSSTLERALGAEDFIRNNLPPQLKGNRMHNKNYKDTWETVVNLVEGIRCGEKLTTISTITGLSVSAVSRIKSGERCSWVFNMYDSFYENKCRQ